MSDKHMQCLSFQVGNKFDSWLTFGEKVEKSEKCFNPHDLFPPLLSCRTNSDQSGEEEVSFSVVEESMRIADSSCHSK